MLTIPDYCLEFAGYCMIGYIILMIGLRIAIRAENPGFGEVFASPIWGDITTRYPWQINAKYILPWVQSPATVASRGLIVRTLFAAARIASAGVAMGFIGFLVTGGYIGIRAA